MARIRSIKPDFFTDEKIAALPLSARLTFIGLWVYVDDNGVGLDNERLIMAAIWPLEEDVIGTLQRTREDLMRLAGDGFIVRYRDDWKRYLAIKTWNRHQRVQHPGKERYPQPSEPGVTSENGQSPEALGKHSRDMHETLAPEQGAGSREQGAGKGAGNPTVAAVNGSVEGTPPTREISHSDLCPSCGAVLDRDRTCFACRTPIGARNAR